MNNIDYSISSGKRFSSAQICTGKCFFSGIQLITDGTNPLTSVVIDTAGGADDYLLSTPTLAIGSTPTAVSNVYFEYLINGTWYSKAAVAAGTAPGNDVIPQSTYGAVAFDIGTDGTIHATEAADNATGYASAALAIAGIAAVAADHVRMGYVTATKSDGAFTFGTTSLAAANSTVAYTSITPTTNKIIWQGGVAGATLYGGRNVTKPVKCDYGLLCSISGTGASYIAEYC